MRRYEQSGSGAGLLLTVIILLGVVYLLFYYEILDYQEIKNKIIKKLPEKTKEKLAENILLTNKTNVTLTKPHVDWCKIQKITVCGNPDCPREAEILGWDVTNDACVIEYKGFDRCLKKDLTIRYAYTGIGGNVVWTTVNGYYVDNELFKWFIENLDREDLGFTCSFEDIQKYPEQVR